MKKFFLLLLLIIPLLGFSQTYQTVQSGEWSDPCTWSLDCNPNSIPPTDGTLNNFTIIINAGHDVKLSGEFIFKNQLTLIVCGKLTVEKDMGETGDLTGNGLDLEVCCGGELIVEGSLRLKNIGRLNINGTFIVDGIYGHQANSGNCIYTSQPECGGVIMTPSGGTPTIENFLYGGDDINDKCEGDTPILPIELLSFTLTPKIDYISIEWSTGSEINNDYFTIFKSTNLYHWDKIGTLYGAGNSSTPKYYSLNDYNPSSGIIYYKLRQTDFDGQFKEFTPLGTQWESNNITLYNINGTIILIAPNYINWDLWVTDLYGRFLYKGKIYSDRISFNLRGNVFIFSIFNKTEKIVIIHIEK